MVLKLSAGKSLSATPFFDLCGFKVLASWPGSEKACPRCKQAGHDSHTCPRKPAPKSRKRRSNRTTLPATTTTSAPLPTSSLTAIPATADTADMEEDSPTSDPI